MPAKSKAQFRFLQAIASGTLKKKGFSRKEAIEFLRGTNFKKLSQRKKR